MFSWNPLSEYDFLKNFLRKLTPVRLLCDLLRKNFKKSYFESGFHENMGTCGVVNILTLFAQMPISGPKTEKCVSISKQSARRRSNIKNLVTGNYPALAFYIIKSFTQIKIFTF